MCYKDQSYSLAYDIVALRVVSKMPSCVQFPLYELYCTMFIIIIIVFNKSWQAQPVQNIDSEQYNRLNDSLQAEPVYTWT